MGRILLIAAAIALAIYAIADCARTPNDQMPAHLPKPIWLLIILLTTPLGPIGWIIISRVMRAENNGGRLDASIWSSDESSIQGIQFGHQHNRPPRDLGPDDDPEFLWRLEKELRAERQARKNANQEPDLPREQQPQENNGATPESKKSDTKPNATDDVETDPADETDPNAANDVETGQTENIGVPEDQPDVNKPDADLPDADQPTCRNEILDGEANARETNEGDVDEDDDARANRCDNDPDESR